MRRRIGTIGGRLLVLVAGTGTVTAVLVSMFVLSQTYARDRRNAIEGVTRDAEVLAIHCQAPLLFRDPVAAKETLAALAPVEHVGAAVLFDDRGAEVARFDSAKPYTGVALNAGSPGHEIRGSWLTFREPVQRGSTTLGTLALAYDISWVMRDLVRNILSTLFASLAAVGIGLLVAFPLQRSIAAPIRELVQAAQLVARDGSFARTRARRFADDELGSLTTVFNQMLERIEQHEERLRRAHERFELANQATNDVLWDWDLLSDRIIWNDAAGTTLAPLKEDRAGTAWEAGRVHPEDAPRVQQSIADAISSGAQRWTDEYRVLRSDGTYGLFINRGIIARDAYGQAYRMIGSMLDLTDRQRAETAIQEGAARLHALMNAIPVFVWGADARGVVRECNEQWHDFTGITADEVREGHWRDAMHPEDLEAMVRRWSLALETTSPYEHEHRMRGRDGSYRWFVSRAVPVVEAGKGVVAWYGTTIDIEDRRRMEDERVALLASERTARQEAEHASKIKDEFLATLSHEIRTPMSAILGWVQLLRTGSPEETADLLQHGLEVIERNARSQAQLIEDLLDMSRIVSGKLRLEGIDVDLAEVIDAARSTVHHTALAKGITIRTDVGTKACMIKGDPNRLQQVVWNLMTNAVKFTPTGGTIEVTLRCIDEHAQVVVHDTGEGIEPEFLPFLFERFRQADSSTTRRFGGLGLGLAIVKQLTELHSGTVRAWSEGRGKGATFTLEFPLLTSGDTDEDEVGTGTGNGAAARPGSVADPHRTRVLLVEDEQDTREAIKRLLERNGCLVLDASNALAALAAFPDFAPHVLVSDISMPGMDGYELIRRVRSRSSDENASVPAIALTAFARVEDRERALRSGYNAHLSKPVEEQELLRVVHGVRGSDSPHQNV